MLATSHQRSDAPKKLTTVVTWSGAELRFQPRRKTMKLSRWSLVGVVLVGCAIGVCSALAEPPPGHWCCIDGLQCGTTWMGGECRYCAEGTTCHAVQHTCSNGVPNWGWVECLIIG